MKHEVYQSGESLLQQMIGTTVAEHCLAVWHLGQEGTAVKGKSGKTLYFDPYLTNSIGESGSFPRNFDPLLEPGKVTNADYVFITHHHQDHLDPDTLRPLSQSSPQAKFIVSGAHVKLLEAAGINRARIISVRAGETEFIDGLKVHPVACKHTDFGIDSNGNHTYLGYIVEIDDICFYHAGDTVLYPELIEEVKKHSIDIAYLPINGGDYFRTRKGIIGNMNYRESIEFAVEIGADLMIPCHYDLMEENYENPGYFVDYLFKHYRNKKFKMMVPGERLLYMKGR